MQDIIREDTCFGGLLAMTDMKGQSITVRSPYWDNMKGILIFLVVLGHFLWDYRDQELAGTVVNFIYIFHMPAFIFVAGYFSKSEKSRSLPSLLKYAVICITFNTAIMIFSRFLLNTSLQLLTPSYSFWFLISILIWRLTIQYVEKVRHILLISVIISILAGLWSDVTNVLALSRTIVFFPFFLAGYRLSGDKVNDYIKNRRPLDYMKGIMLLIFTVCMSLVFIRNYAELNESDFLMQSYTAPLDLIERIAILGFAALMTMSMVMTVPGKPLPFLCKWGRNSLIIFILHRFITLIFVKIFPASNYSALYCITAFIASILTLLICGSDRVSGMISHSINKITDSVSPGKNVPDSRKTGLSGKIPVICVILYFLLPIFTVILSPVKTIPAGKDISSEVMHTIMTEEQKSALKDALSISFTGDLILLQDQVQKAYSDSTGEYDFSPMFEYARRYLAAADISIGVFEGPAAGEEAGYSTSNYDDGIPLYLNFPDSFAKAVKESGIDLVSTANNHLLDKGEEGAMRTLDILDQVGLLHVGSYRDEAEKQSFMILEKKGVRIAFLVYTLGSNGYTEEYFLRENTSITSILANPDSKFFNEAREKVISDFRMVKNSENPPDLIVVIPHMGTQFIHNTDKYQNTWNDIFIRAGADIVLGDHSHAVQPVEFRTASDDAGNAKQTVIINCPGNFANSFIEKDGDATSIAEVYIDPETKEILCAGVIPMYTRSTADGNYQALPIYSILTEPDLKNEISGYEMKRISEVQSVVTSVMLGTELTLDQAQEKYFLFPEGYVRQPAEAIEMTDEMRGTDLCKLLSQSKTICFVGDSITAGSENGGYGWYEPMMAAFPEITVNKEAWGSATTQTLLKNSGSIAERCADLYVIAIGTNDVRYRNSKTCAMDKVSYIENIDRLIKKIKEENPQAHFVLISPWLARDNDPYTAIPVEKRDQLLTEYSDALELYCEENRYGYIDPNPAIKEALLKCAPSDFLIDHIHPNASAGIALYSEKVLAYSKSKR